LSFDDFENGHPPSVSRGKSSIKRKYETNYQKFVPSIFDSHFCDLGLFPQSKLSVKFSREVSSSVSQNKLIRNLIQKLSIFKSV